MWKAIDIVVLHTFMKCIVSTTEVIMENDYQSSFA